MNEMFIGSQFKGQEIANLEYRKKWGIQQSDVMIHIHGAGESCNEECQLWQLNPPNGILSGPR